MIKENLCEISAVAVDCTIKWEMSPKTVGVDSAISEQS
jgi:hypothetical protein